MKKLIAAIAFYLVGLLILNTWGLVNNEWSQVYYWWDKGKDLFVFIGIYSSIAKRFRFILIPVIIYSGIRLIWQIISTFTGLNINNTQAIGVLFILLALACICLLFVAFRKWHTIKR